MLSRTQVSGTNAGARRPAPWQASEMTNTSPSSAGSGVWHPIGLPEGYHPVPGGKHGKLDRRWGGTSPPGHRVIGLRRADGMPPSPGMQDS